MQEKNNISLKNNPVLYIFPAVVILIHLYINLFTAYGIFRDEFYYIACSSRLDAGYVDHPPFSIYVLWLSRFIFGDSLFGLRLLPSLAGGVFVLMVELLTIRLGGKLFASVTAGIAAAFAPLMLAIFSFYSMNFLDYLFWVSAAYIIIMIVDDNKPVHWVWLGVVLGLGLLNKISVFWLGAGFAAGLIFTPLRASLKTKWPYICAATAFVIFLPFIIWNITHDYAHLEFINNASRLKYGGITTADFITGIIKDMNPFAVIIWLPGLYYFFFTKEGKKYRILGIIFVTAFLILLINGHSKSEYLGPAFPYLFMGGALLVENLKRFKFLEYAKYAVPVILIITGIIAMPFAVNILSVEKFISYAKAMGVQPANSESKQLEELPQFYADMFGWEDLAKTVSRVYQSLPDSEKAHTVVFALNYGEAGAIEYYSRKYPLPRVVCPQNSCWYWGKKEFRDVKTAIVTGGLRKDHLESCEVVTVAAIVKTRYSMPYENNLPVFICKKIKRPLRQIWYEARFFI